MLSCVRLLVIVQIPLQAIIFCSDAAAQIASKKDAQITVRAADSDEGRPEKTAKVADRPFEPVAAPEVLDSPRLAALAKELDAGLPPDLEQFWKEAQGHTPLIEPFPGDASSSWATFLYRGNAETHAVMMLGGPWALSTDGRGMNLSRLRKTDLWYRSVRMPNDARMAYEFLINLSCRIADDPSAGKLYDSNTRRDVLNPQFIRTPDELRPVVSVLEMPQAPAQPYIHAAAGIRRGTITDHRIRSDVLRQTRTYSLYTPPGYDGQGEALPLVVMFDGGSYHTDNYIPGHTIVDNLIAAKKIPPIVVAFVDSIERQKELNCSQPFAEFLATELVPRIRGERHVSLEAKRTIVGGMSLGGLMASFCALHHSDVFGNVISQSGAYWYFPECFTPPTVMSTPGGTLTDEFVKAPRAPVRFYLEAGKFENDVPGNLLAENRRLRDVLLAKGYEVMYSEFSGGHHYVNWRGSFADALMAILRQQ